MAERALPPSLLPLLSFLGGPVRPPPFFLAVPSSWELEELRESRWSKLPEEDICGCDSALPLSRETGEAAKGGERKTDLVRSGAANREGKPTATTVRYMVSDLSFSDRFFGSSPEFGVDVYLGIIVI